MRSRGPATALLALVVCAVGTASAHGETRSLSDCIAIAVQQHPLLRAAVADVALARARVGQAVAPGLPQITASYAATRQRRTLAQLLQGLEIDIAGTDVTAVPDTFTYQEGRFVLNQLLFDFGRVLLMRRAALADLTSAHDDRARVEGAVVLTVKETYFELLVARRMLGVAQESVGQTTLTLKTANSRFNAGQAARFDVVRQELAVAGAELEVKTAEGNIALARENLRDAMGLSEPITFDPDDAALAPLVVSIDEDQALALAYERRPELHGIAAQRDAQTARIDALVRSYLPVALGTADYLFSGDKEPGPQEGWSIGALVRLPIFDGGLTAARLSEARAQLMNLEATERQLRQHVLLEVRESLVKLRRAEDSLPVSNKAVEVAREALRISGTRYESGIADVVELVTSQVALSTASARQAQILAEGQIALARLEHAVNGPVMPAAVPGPGARSRTRSREAPPAAVQASASAR